MGGEGVGGDDLAAFAEDLRALRKSAGYPTFGELSARCDITPITPVELAEAARGLRLPTWTVVEAYVSACGGNPDSWRRRHAALIAARREQRRVYRPAIPARRSTRDIPISVIASVLILVVAVLGVGSANKGGGGASGAAAVNAPVAAPTTPDGPVTTDGTHVQQQPMTIPTTAAATLPLGTLIKRADSPEVSVYADGSRIPYTTWNDLVSGYGTYPLIDIVSDAYYDSLPTTLPSGVLIKEAGDATISATAGSQRVDYATWGQLVADYGADPSFVTVPTYYFDETPAVPRSSESLPQ